MQYIGYGCTFCCRKIDIIPIDWILVGSEIKVAARDHKRLLQYIRVDSNSLGSGTLLSTRWSKAPDMKHIICTHYYFARKLSQEVGTV